MFKKKISVLYLVLAAVCGGLISVGVLKYLDTKPEQVSVTSNESADINASIQFPV